MNEEAIELIDSNQYSCVIVKGNKILHCVNGKGISPLLDLYQNHKDNLKDSFLADKVIGKAAAILIAKAKVKHVYGKILSKSAIDILNKYSIAYECGKEVEIIYNKGKTDKCPMEKTVFACDDLDEGLLKIIEFCNNMRDRDVNKSPMTIE